MDDKCCDYEIVILGQLDPRWEEWFDRMLLSTTTHGLTILTGVVDQVTLRGMLNKIWDLNLTLVSVKRQTGRDVEAILG
ncbi:MAG: hypothetical protein JW892_12780 [Anaerolineae bacterium]|nr:hypothetical protein [Anaerolineae bacterium]